MKTNSSICEVYLENTVSYDENRIRQSIGIGFKEWVNVLFILRVFVSVEKLFKYSNIIIVFRLEGMSFAVAVTKMESHLLLVKY